MASLINLKTGFQQSYASLQDKDYAIKSTPFFHDIDIDYPIIAKGNKIEGIKAKW